MVNKTMCSRYVESQCSVCRRYLDQSSCRIIVEICGHQKCRECFITEEDGCSICKQYSQQKLKNGQNTFLSNEDAGPEINQQNQIDVNEGQISQNQIVANGAISSESVIKVKKSYDEKPDDNLSHIIPTTNGSGKILSYNCTICQKTFKSKTNRKYHLFCDKNRAKPFQCNRCDKQFITQAHLKYHESTHQTDQKFVCKFCHRIYLREIALKKHLRKHTSEYKFHCEQCDEKFKLKEQYNMHQNRHNKIFHKCPYLQCGKEFLVKSNLTKHIQSHSGENRKQCSVCKKYFSGNSALRTHMLTHSNLKSHQCTTCMKKFIDQRTLERHSKIHFENLLYECTVCSAKSGRKDNIRRHVRNLHADSEERVALILKTIFDNFTLKQNRSIKRPIPTKKTENQNLSLTNDSTAKCTKLPKPKPNIIVDDVNQIETSKVLRSNATSVIKFAGRAPVQIQEDVINNRNPSAEKQTNKFNQPVSTTTVDVESPSDNLDLPPLNYDPFPKFAPLKLNTNTNLTVYRQLLSPYLRKASATDCNNKTTESGAEQPRINQTVKTITPPTKVIDRPPKKMIEKYEIYRN